MANLIGTGLNQVPTNGLLGNMAFQNKEAVSMDLLTTTGNVGIGTGSPGARLHVSGGNFYISGSGTYSEPTVIAGVLSFDSANGDLNISARSSGGDTFTRFWTSSAGAGAERMRLTATGNLGIGTSAPSSGLELLRAGDALFTLTGNTASGNVAGIDFKRNTGTVNASIRSQSVGGNDIGEIYFSTRPSAGSLTERMRLDSAGNLGLGVTPGAWRNTFNALQIGARGAFWSSTGAGSTQLSNNVLYDAVGFKYIGSAAATNYEQGSGAHYWYTAASGTAGNAITFTQAMTLDASGNLGIGTASPTRKLTVVGSATNTYVGINSGDNASLTGVLFGGTSFPSNGQLLYSTADNSMRFSANGSERMRITADGNIQVGTASLATNATNGFPYIPTCAGTPTGTPTAITGYAPMVVDSTNNKLYVYVGGAWQAMN